jgi:hypothetical protein
MNSDMKQNITKAILLFLLAGIFSCKTKIEEPKITSGRADLSKYLAVGGSYTAGYMDGALYIEGQQNSYPLILSKSFSAVTPQNFKQPLMNPGVGIGVDSNAKLILTSSNFCYGTSLSPEFAAAAGDISNYEWIGNQGPFSNIGVPGLRIYEVNNQLFGNPQAGNPFYARFVKMQDNNHTLLSDMSEFDPTFFTLWVGMDDLLPYAISGGTKDNDPLTANDFSTTFGAYFETMVSALTANNAKGALGSVPQILDFPYFSSIPYDGVVLTAADAASMNAVLSSTYPDLQFHEGNNPFIIDDPFAHNGKRFIKSNEFILMSVPLDSIKCFHFGSYDLSTGRLNALPDKYVIDETEAHLITQKIFDFDEKIKTVAEANDLAYVDMYDFFRQVDNGIKLNNVTFTLDFLEGSVFSLDGLHPTAKGNALVANQFINAINLQYGASLREADANAYPGIKFP